jgi:hypothetical protein
VCSVSKPTFLERSSSHAGVVDKIICCDGRWHRSPAADCTCLHVKYTGFYAPDESNIIPQAKLDQEDPPSPAAAVSGTEQLGSTQSIQPC